MGEWITLICDNPNPSEIFDEYNISEDKRWKIISHLPKNYVHPEIHPEAFYVSRPLPRNGGTPDTQVSGFLIYSKFSKEIEDKW
ncbi:7915_t:CDS:2 [Rhizophagus irregularis]|nr:7915_t:CDS:2 [Rhizophagus irregularis]